MDIEEFFELSLGKWFAHRTTQNIALKKSQESKSDIFVEKLTATHTEIINLFEEYSNLEDKASDKVSFGVKISWNDTTKLNQKKSGNTILAILSAEDNFNTGKWLQQTGKNKQLIIGHYMIGDDRALTLSTQNDNFSLTERIWFASPNLRMRVNTIEESNGLNTACFTSEIRMGAAPPEAAKVSAKIESEFS
ncbi:MAG: phycobiliprotein lyase [Cyanobacteria bacterium P01_A01_bin.84]